MAKKDSDTVANDGAFLTKKDLGSRIKKAVTYPSRSINTAAAKGTGRDFKEMRRKEPGKYLTDEELRDYKPRKK